MLVVVDTPRSFAPCRHLANRVFIKSKFTRKVSDLQVAAQRICALLVLGKHIS